MAANPPVVGALTTGFQASAWRAALPLGLGLLANNIIRAQLSRLPAIGEYVATGKPGNLLAGVATAGVLSMTSRFIRPEVAPAVLAGGLADVLLAAIKQFVGVGLADYLTPRQLVYGARGMSGGGADGLIPVMAGRGYVEDELMEAMAKEQEES
jgi:hypothetical protein